MRYSNIHFCLISQVSFFLQIMNPQSLVICGDKIKALLGYVLCVEQGMGGLLQVTLSTLPFHIGSVLAVDNLH